jgi:DNA-binding response OmpR family regulator/anti-sigma regulatory factor (Ser/Thr protein kinase)
MHEVTLFEAIRAATLAEVSWLRRAMARRLKDSRLSQEIVDDLQLVLSEVATNAVEHSHPPPNSLRVCVDLIGTNVAIAIEDDGGGFADFAPAHRQAESKSIPSEALSGRGLSLIRDALNRYSYQMGRVNRFVGWKSLFRNHSTVLIVEDNPLHLRVYSDYLCKDHRVIACTSLSEAKTILQDHHIDLILTDFHLGDGLGTALLRECQQFRSAAAPPVVLTSADQSTRIHESAIRFGAEFFIPKPVQRDVMLSTISLALSRTAVRHLQIAKSFASAVDGFVAPDLPKALGNCRAVSASETASTGGGDLILHFALTHAQRIVLVDVMGHGVAAKAWAIAYAAIIRTLHQCHPDLSAPEFLTRLAKLAWTERSLESAMATVLVADIDGNSATIASAGHPSPLIAGKRLRRAAVDGPLLGVMPPQPYKGCKITINKGERLVMFTDGIDPVEVAAGGEMPPWFQNTIILANDMDLDDAIIFIRDATERMLGPQPSDDWTIAIIENA